MTRIIVENKAARRNRIRILKRGGEEGRIGSGVKKTARMTKKRVSSRNRIRSKKGVRWRNRMRSKMGREV